MALRDFFWGDPVWRSKAVTASPEVLEAIGARQFSAFPLIAVPNTSDHMRAAFEAAISATYGQMYRTQPSVRAVVDFLARNVAQLALRLYERTSDIERHEASDHPAAQTLRNPNPQTPGNKFIFDLVRDHLVYGNAFALKSRLNPQAPLVLTQLPPARTSVVGPGYFRVDAYRVYAIDGTHQDFAPGDIFHWLAATNPNDPRLGLSPLETLRQVLAEDAASQTANVELLKAGLVKPGYVKRPLDAPEWSDAGMDRFREAWQNALKESARKTPVLEEGMDFDDFGITPKDAQMLDGRRFTTEEVCRVYGVPKGLMGVTDAPSADEREEFYADVLPPLCELFASYLDLSILQGEFNEPKMYFEFDLDEKLMGNDRLTALTSAAGAPPLTRNEARAMLNKPPKEGGDELITPLNVTEGGKPSPQVMPIQDPNAPPQDGSHRTASVNGEGKAIFLARHKAQRQRRDRYAGEFEAELKRFYNAVERDKALKALDTARWVKNLASRLLKLMRSVVEREGSVAGASFGATFDAALVQNYLAAVATGEAERMVSDLQFALTEKDASEVYATAKDVWAQGAGSTLGTKMTNFAQTEAAKQTPDASDRLKTWRVHILEKSQHPEMDGQTVPLTADFVTPDGHAKNYPPYGHPGCECMVDVR